jgi:Predicted pyridoxal phosphate-dependent enzyme apparently involved in regulation of cell wall biogenesis
MRRIPVNKPTITDLEIEYVTDAITNGWGSHCYDYINRFTAILKERYDVKRAWTMSSCHGAIHTALMALGVGPGDEVIVPDITWIGSVSPIVWLGAKPVFVDILKDTWCIDPESIEAHITPKTKAIIIVHLYGSVCEMDEIMEIGSRMGIAIIEDAAEAVGSEYHGKLVGSIGDFGVFSFHGTKTFTTGEGGALISNRDDLAERISTICNQGRRPQQHIMFWVDEIGLKYKMSNLDAALGVAQFERFDGLVSKKREIFSWYKQYLREFEDISINIEKEGTKNLFWMPSIIFGNSYKLDREKMIRDLNEEGIGLRPFFFPVSMFPMFEERSDNLVSYSLYKKGINLPSYHDMAEDDVKFVCDRLKEYLDKVNARK